jgi:hypothetical protein
VRRVLVLLLLFAPLDARADSGALFGESPRTVSLADAVVGRPGDTSAIFYNPAGIGDVARPTLVLLGHFGARQIHFARDGEPGTSDTRITGGYGLSLVAALPGPDWLSRLRIGAAVQLPGESVITVIAPPRRDTPIEPWYGDRLDRTAVSVAFGYEIPYGLRLGVGISVFPSLIAPTIVGYDAHRGEDVDDGVIVNQTRDLTLDFSFSLGARWQIVPEVGVGLAWRQGGATRASGEFTILAGSIAVVDRYQFYDFSSPEEVALGVVVQPLEALSVSLDLTWGRWSTYRTIHDELPDPGFSDVIDVRVGAEYLAAHGIALRGGYAFLPSPVPEQIGLHNFLDAHRHEIAFGMGVNLEESAHVPVRIDLALRYHVQHEQRATKDIVYDADTSALGVTIDNLGYPGFRSRGSFGQVSLSATFFLDGQYGERAAEPEPETETEAEPETETEAEAEPEPEPETETTGEAS